MTDEEQLAGGVANAGQVTRVGTHVLRPANAHSRDDSRVPPRVAGCRLRRHVGARRDRCRRRSERLEFIPGDVAVPPYPAWAQTDDALASVAELLRRFHAAVADLRFRGGGVERGDGRPGAARFRRRVHRLPQRRVPRERRLPRRCGRRPPRLRLRRTGPSHVRRRRVGAHVCADRRRPQRRTAGLGTGRPARATRRVADAYGLDAAGRAEMFASVADTIARGGEFVRRHVEAGEPGFIRMWNEMGGAERFDRRRRWWAECETDFRRALA